MAASSAAFLPLYIPTVASNVTRGLDLLREPISGNILTTVLSGSVEYIPTAVTTAYLFESYIDASNYTSVLYDGSKFVFRKRIGGTNYDATKTVAIAIGTKYKIAWRFDQTKGSDIFVNGSKGTGNANTTALQLDTYFYVGAGLNATIPAGLTAGTYPAILSVAGTTSWRSW